MSFSLFRSRQLSPDADGGGGGDGAGAGAGAAGGAGTGAGSGSGTGAGAGTPAFDPNEFTTYKAESERRYSELTESHKSQKEILDRLSGVFGKGGQGSDAPLKEPKRSEFPQGEAGALAFIDARADYRYDIKNRANTEAGNKSKAEQDEARQTETSVREAGIGHNKRIAEAQSELPDFAAVVGAVKFPFGDALSMDIMSCDNSAHVVHHLAKTPADLQQLWLLEQTNPRKAQRMLDILDEGFTASKKAAATKTNSHRFQPTAKTGGKTDKASAKDLVRKEMWD